LPLFLEGFVHALKVEENQNSALQLYQRIKESPLYDKRLKMYKVNADLSEESEEIGRLRIFPRGWLENESVWLHMEYKYLLELLRCGLYEEFFETFRDVLIPFLKAEFYGRSVLENSSFLVSSVHEDASLHGQGFVSRLSGSTCEFLHIWLLMNAGARPFELTPEGELVLSFKPILPEWLFLNKETKVAWFDKEGKIKRIILPAHSYAFKFLGQTLTIYHNPHRKDTFGPKSAVIREISLKYPRQKNPVRILSSHISSAHAFHVRHNQVEQIDVYFK